MATTPERPPTPQSPCKRCGLPIGPDADWAAVLGDGMYHATCWDDEQDDQQ